MARYVMTNKDMDSYFSLDMSIESYRRDKKHILNPRTRLYGAKLIRQKTVKTGLEIKVKMFWDLKYRFTLKPDIMWRKYEKHIHWLNFMIWVGYAYTDKDDKIIGDYINGIEPWHIFLFKI